MKVNVSLLKTWMGCPLQARFKEIEKRPWKQNAKASFGTCIHDALDQYNRYGDFESALIRFKTTWENPDLLGVTPEVWPRGNTYGGLRDKGIEILSQYHEKQAWESRIVVGTEHKFCVPFGDHELSGVVDLIEGKMSGRGKNTLKIVDYKTNTRKPTKLQLAMDIQFTAYVYASLQEEFWVGMTASNGQIYPGMANGEDLFDRYKRTARRASWYHLWTNQELDAGDRDDDDYMRLYRCVEEVVKASEAKIFVPNISGDTCTFCDYTDVCKAVIPIREKLVRIKEGIEDHNDEGMF